MTVEKEILDAEKAAIQLEKTVEKIKQSWQDILRLIDDKSKLLELEVQQSKELIKQGKSISLLSQQAAEAEKAKADRLKEIVDKSDALIEKIINQIKLLEDEKKLKGDLTEKQKHYLNLLETERAIYVKRNIEHKEEYKNHIKITEALSEQAEISADLEDSTANILGLIGLQKNAWSSGLLGKMEKARSLGMSYGDQLKVIGREIRQTVTVSNLLAGTLDGIKVATVAAVSSFDSARSSLNKTTGAAGEYDKAVVDLGLDHLELGIDAEGAAEAIGALRQEFTGFTRLTKEGQKEVALLTATMARFGVSAETTAQNLEILTKITGMSISQAATSQKEIAATAKQLGVNVGQALSDFAKVAPDIAAHGKNMVRVFRDLQVVSKATGIEIQSLVNIAKQFDTFEGAAQAVGKLNAILGGPFLDSIQMIHTTDPTERFKALRNAILNSGKSYETMSYYQRKAIADAAGLSGPAELAKLLSGELEKNAAAAKANGLSQTQMAEMAKKATSIYDKLKNMMNAFVIALDPVISGVRWALNVFLDLNKALGGNLIPIIAGLLAIWKTAVVVSKAVAAGSFLAALGLKAQAAAQVEQTATAAPATAGITAMGAAMAGAAAGFVSFGFGAFLVGAAIALIGVGIWLALKGLTAFFGLLIKNLDKLGMFSLQMIGLSFALMLMLPGALAASLGIAILSASLLGLAFSLAFIKTDDLMSLATLFEALASFSSSAVTGLVNTAKAVDMIAASINKINTNKAIAFTIATTGITKLAASPITTEASARVNSTINSTRNLINQSDRVRTTTNERNTTTAPSVAQNNVMSSKPVQINLNLDGRTLKKFIIDVLNTEANPRKV